MNGLNGSHNGLNGSHRAASIMKIFIPTPLRQYAGKKDAVEVRASTVGAALAELTTSHPDLKRHLYTEDGKLRAFVNLYLNDEDVRYLAQKEQTPVKDGDSLSIIPSIAGGREDFVISRFGDFAIASKASHQFTKSRNREIAK